MPTEYGRRLEKYANGEVIWACTLCGDKYFPDFCVLLEHLKEKHDILESRLDIVLQRLYEVD
jgi:hypothetical protein